MKKSVMDALICRQEGFSDLSRSILERRQLELLNMQLARAKQSPYYREYPDSLDSLEELQRLPFTTEADLRENYAGLCLLPAAELVRIRTSGTTGTPKKLAYSRYDCDRTLDFFTAGLQELIFPGDRVLIAFSGRDALSLGGLLEETVRELKAVPLRLHEDKSFGSMCRLLNREAPAVYLGPPVLLLSLLRYDRAAVCFKRALVSGDICEPEVVSVCSSLMGNAVWQHYGLRESGLGCAVSCSAGEGMHIRENDILCEIIDESGNRLPEEEWGELVITTVGMEAMPLFRYRTGDRARLLPEICPCGSLVRRLEVSGRLEGDTIGYLDSILFSIPEVVDFRAEGNTLTVLTVRNEEEVAAALRKLCRGMEITVRRILPGDSPCYEGKRKILQNNPEKTGMGG